MDIMTNNEGLYYRNDIGKINEGGLEVGQGEGKSQSPYDYIIK